MQGFQCTDDWCSCVASSGGRMTWEKMGEEGQKKVNEMRELESSDDIDDPAIRLAVTLLLLGEGEPSSQEDILAIRKKKMVGVPQVRIETGS